MNKFLENSWTTTMCSFICRMSHAHRLMGAPCLSRPRLSQIKENLRMLLTMAQRYTILVLLLHPCDEFFSDTSLGFLHTNLHIFVDHAGSCKTCCCLWSISPNDRRSIQPSCSSALSYWRFQPGIFFLGLHCQFSLVVFHVLQYWSIFVTEEL